MPDCFCEIEGVRVMDCAAEGGLVSSGQDAVDLIGLARSHQADLVILPATRLGEDFFQLKTRIAGEVIQKFATYGVRIAILGDLSRYLSDSSALRDFVRESNNRSDCWFVANREELQRQLIRHR
jgi:hypothetical protein